MSSAASVREARLCAAGGSVSSGGRSFGFLEIGEENSKFLIADVIDIGGDLKSGFDVSGRRGSTGEQGINFLLEGRKGHVGFCARECPGRGAASGAFGRGRVRTPWSRRCAAGDLRRGRRGSRRRLSKGREGALFFDRGWS